MHYMSRDYESADDIVNAFYHPRTEGEYKTYMKRFLAANENTLALPHAGWGPSPSGPGGLPQPDSLFWVPEHDLDSYDSFYVDDARRACYNVNKYPGWERFQMRRLVRTKNDLQTSWAMAQVNESLAWMKDQAEDNAAPAIIGAYEAGFDYTEKHIEKFHESVESFKTNLNEYLRGEKAFKPEMKELLEHSYKEMNAHYIKSVKNFATIVGKGSIMVRHGLEDTFKLSDHAIAWATNPERLETLTRAMKWCKLGFISLGFEIVDGSYEVYKDYKEGKNWAKKAAEVAGEIVVGAALGVAFIALAPECMIGALAAGAVAGIAGDHIGGGLGDGIYDGSKWVERTM